MSSNWMKMINLMGKWKAATTIYLFGTCHWNKDFDSDSFPSNFLKIKQARHNFSKTEGAARKLGGRILRIMWILTFLGDFSGKLSQILKKLGGSPPPPLSDAPVKKYINKVEKSISKIYMKSSYRKENGVTVQKSINKVL